ncbi:porin family protein [Flavobacterium tibetense]|uniref:PorT family protein n=1 Tax=Flavobacterium tibetense TaxID=2233533 RepID=A0A365P1U2_9FLAO|nr:porin family protein [Flavobacterium tibetense]RBA28291.1 PorT family protein [Flavobacterium tibetense]
MKKAILTIALITLSVSNSVAQESTSTDNREKLFFGLKVGANYSNVYDSESEDFVADSKFGLVAGAFVSIPLGKFIGVQPEVLFSQKGFKSSGTFLGTEYKATRTTNYIDVPLLLAVKPVEFITILFGPQYSYLMKQKDEFTSGSFSSSEEEEFTNDNIRKNTFSLIGGADLNFNNFVIGLRSGWDLKNNQGDGSSNTPRYKNMWYQATVGYRF